MNQTATIKQGDRVVYLKNGKTYVAQYDSRVNTRLRVDPTLLGVEMVWAQPINAKTGKPWQAGIERPVTDFQVTT